MKKSREIEIIFAVGDKIESEHYGKGEVKQIDPTDATFTYLAYFKDGTRAWFNGKDAHVI